MDVNRIMMLRIVITWCDELAESEMEFYEYAKEAKSQLDPSTLSVPYSSKLQAVAHC